MGCTSSAPNMVEANPKATEKISDLSEEDTEQSIKEDDDIISAEEENGKNEIKVLPSCDTLADPIQLDSINKSMIDSSNLNLEKDLPIDEILTESVIDNVAKDAVEEVKTEEKISSLEDVVGKVVELYVADNLIYNTKIVSEQDNQQIDDNIEKKKEEPDRLIDLPQEPEDQTKESTEESLDEATSPSQSTSSRATRWEALADIAAELPPSLTVDPVTGHIYALSK